MRKLANFFHVHSAGYDMEKSSKKRHKKDKDNKLGINVDADLNVDSNVTVNRDDSFTIPEATIPGGGVSADAKLGHSHSTPTTTANGDIKLGVDTTTQGNGCSDVLIGVGC